MSGTGGRGPAPTVSIIVPTYNRPQLLARALRTVQAQTAADWEVVCVDDASRVPAVDVVASLGDGRIRVIRLSKRGGAGRARNAGIAAARSDLVAFLDDDNEWLPGLLDSQLARLGEPDGAAAAAVHCLAYRCDEAAGRVAVSRRRPPGADLLHALARGWCPFMSCTIVRRGPLLRCGGFDGALPAFDDYDLFLRLAVGGARFVAVDRPLVTRYERHAAGTMSTDPDRLARALVALDEIWREPLRRRLGRLGHRRWRARLRAQVELVSLREGLADGRGPRLALRVAGMARLAPWAPVPVAQAFLLAALGPRAYHRVALLKDRADSTWR